MTETRRDRARTALAEIRALVAFKDPPDALDRLVQFAEAEIRRDRERLAEQVKALRRECGIVYGGREEKREVLWACDKVLALLAQEPEG